MDVNKTYCDHLTILNSTSTNLLVATFLYESLDNSKMWNCGVQGRFSGDSDRHC